jgi:deoxyhypusine synthase
MKHVHQITPKNNITVNNLLSELTSVGVMGAGKLALSTDILESMIKEKNCKVFMGVAGAMIPGGMKNILIEYLKNKWIDVFVTTGAMLTHDLVEALGYHHYQGSEKADDLELKKQGYDRMFDSYMPNNVYEGLEDFFEKHTSKLQETNSIAKFLKILGKLAPKDSLINTAYKNNIPIFCPALSDSGLGLMVWGQTSKGKEFKVKAFEDLKDIMDIAWTSTNSGVFYIGGGTPKNFIQQSMQFAPNLAKYGVQITTDRPEPGGSSGAPLKEGISWGKLNPKANYVDLICDATIALPFITSALKDRLR